MDDNHDCTPYCRSRIHGDDCAAVVQCPHFSDADVGSYLKWKCRNYCSLQDSGGRSLAHVAASMGRIDLLRHLLLNHDCLNKLDEESGYSLLHASIFHGQVGCAVRLIQLGANLNVLDGEGLTPLEISSKDLLRNNIIACRRDNTHSLELYLWGLNANNTLGCGHNRERALPEPQEFFRKNKIFLRQVVLQKFHTVFVGENGTVWSCGHGSGGRLGLGSENAALEPKEIHKPDSMSCTAAAVGDDHTILLMNTGMVFTFGLNNYNQLGHSLPTTASLLSPKRVRSLSGIFHVAASHFHSVFCSEKQLFTCGLNAGQLGHAASTNGANCIITPEEVKSFKLKEGTIVNVASSAGAVVVLSSTGGVYLFHNYRCTRLTPRDWIRKGKKVVVMGGTLDSRVVPATVSSENIELKVGLLADEFVFLWRSSTEQFYPCLYSIQRELLISDLAFFGTGCIFCTNDGEAFTGYFKDGKKVKMFELVDVRKLPRVHRGMAVAADPRGRNYSVLQVNPLVYLNNSTSVVVKRTINADLAALLDETDESDDIHDIVFKVGERRFPAHGYIVFHSRESSAMLKILEEKNNSSAQDINIPDVSVEQFERVLRFIYTGLVPNDPNKRSTHGNNGSIDKKDNEEVHNQEISAFEHYQKKKKKDKNDVKNEGLQDGGIKFAARRLGVAGLTGKTPNQGPSWLQRKAGEFDAKLVSLDGTSVHVHKCILIARLDFFRVMLTHGWREAKEVELKIPVNGRVLEVLVDYMYTNESRDVNACEDVDFLATVLVAADELICEGLRHTVEEKLIQLLNIRNAVDFLQLAITYNAEMVENFAKRFIATHLPVFLEARSLEVLSDETLAELSTLYREFISPYRRLKSSLDDVEVITIKSVAEAYPIVLDVQGDLAKPVVKEKTPSPRKKDRRERRTSERQRLSSLSDSVEQMSLTPTSPKEEGIQSGNRNDDNWIEATKGNKTLQSRLRGIAEAKNVQPVLGQMTPLSKPIQATPAQTTPPIKIPVDSSLRETLETDFPLLNSNARQERIILERPTHNYSFSEVPKKFTKLSQRERRRLTSQSEPLVEEPPPPKSAWATIPPLGFTPDSKAGETQLAAIISSEQQERERAARFRSKPLALTQIEDRAIHDLLLFYNVDGVTDEKITVRRLVAGNVAAPVWVSSHR